MSMKHLWIRVIPNLAIRHVVDPGYTCVEGLESLLLVVKDD